MAKGTEEISSPIFAEGARNTKNVVTASVHVASSRTGWE
jgi:hypothetical protein